MLEKKIETSFTGKLKLMLRLESEAGSEAWGDQMRRDSSSIVIGSEAFGGHLSLALTLVW